MCLSELIMNPSMEEVSLTSGSTSPTRTRLDELQAQICSLRAMQQIAARSAFRCRTPVQLRRQPTSAVASSAHHTDPEQLDSVFKAYVPTQMWPPTALNEFQPSPDSLPSQQHTTHHNSDTIDTDYLTHYSHLLQRIASSHPDDINQHSSDPFKPIHSPMQVPLLDIPITPMVYEPHLRTSTSPSTQRASLSSSTQHTIATAPAPPRTPRLAPTPSPRAHHARLSPHPSVDRPTSTSSFSIPAAIMSVDGYLQPPELLLHTPAGSLNCQQQQQSCHVSPDNTEALHQNMFSGVDTEAHQREVAVTDVEQHKNHMAVADMEHKLQVGFRRVSELELLLRRTETELMQAHRHMLRMSVEKEMTTLARVQQMIGAPSKVRTTQQSS